jgi:hypothetical protein
VDAVGRACQSICAHLSEPLYDLVLNMVYDYASTNVRSNAVRGIHLLIEALANADPFKCLAKFFPLCERNIRIELENGASSLRNTSVSSPIPSDATLHWCPFLLLSFAPQLTLAQILPYYVVPFTSKVFHRVLASSLTSRLDSDGNAVGLSFQTACMFLNSE